MFENSLILEFMMKFNVALSDSLKLGYFYGMDRILKSIE